MKSLNYGWANPTLEEQLEAQGLEFVNDFQRDWAVRLFDAINLCYINGVISKGEMARTTARFHKKLTAKSLAPHA